MKGWGSEGRTQVFVGDMKRCLQEPAISYVAPTLSLHQEKGKNSGVAVPGRVTLQLPVNYSKRLVMLLS